MRLMRNNIFETNSSSTNTLCIDTEATLIIPEKLKLVEVGGSRDFDFSDPNSKFSILAYFCSDVSEFLSLCYKIYGFGVKEIELFSPKTYSGNLDYSGWFWCDAYDSEEELRECLSDDNLLKHWLFSPDSYISGYDNNYDY